ncbi:hypothetical protein CFR72_15815 [Gluconacetobacter entanii]|uniref:Right handed beta helix domain-containing protein n=2 Tax=Gluconacetobacter entanii TaxID=108528 RepID=A0A318Q7Q9_9PROT|nr:hypothetical protein CFR72_15815 [Gluconacetobacter entanii]
MLIKGKSWIMKELRLLFAGLGMIMVSTEACSAASVFVCDGKTDNTLSLQKVINELVKSGEILEIHGNCVVDSLFIPSHSHITGSGNASITESKASKRYLINLQGGIRDTIIENLTFDNANAPLTGSSTIYMPAGGRAIGLSIINNRFINIPKYETTKNQAGHAIELTGSNSTFIEKNIIEQSSGDTIQVNDGYFIVRDNYVANSGDGCIAFNNGARGQILGNTLYKCNLGVGAGPEGSQSDKDINQSISISNNIFESCLWGINMGWFAYPGRSGPVNWQVSGNTFRDSGKRGVEYDGYSDKALVNGTISGNSFYGTGSSAYDGVTYDGKDVVLNNSSVISITGNTILNPKGIEKSQIAIKINNSRYFSVNGNVIYDEYGKYKYYIDASNSKFGNIVGNTTSSLKGGVLTNDKSIIKIANIPS